MAIMSSTIVEDAPQIDSRRHMRELHVDHLGVPYFVRYIAQPTSDVVATMNARVPQIELELATQEMEQIYRDLPEPPSLKHATMAQLLVFLRAQFRELRGTEVGRVARWLLNRTDVQLRAMFGITAVELASLKLRLQSARDKYETSESLSGE